MQNCYQSEDTKKGEKTNKDLKNVQRILAERI